MKTLPILLALALFLAACGQDQATPEPGTAPQGAVSEPPGAEPDHIAVAHILIGVKNPRFPKGRYELEKAREVAQDLLEQIRGGADFDALMRNNTEDPGPGVYPMSNSGVDPTGPQETSRDDMVPAFGDVGFTLRVGEVGLAEFDPVKSPFGFHIIKRVR